MRRWTTVLVVSLAAAALSVAAGLAARPTIAKKTPTGTLVAENAAFNAGDWAAMWSAYTANYRTKCGPYAKWKATIAALHRQIGTLTTKVLGVKITGSRAALVYQLLAGGKVVFTVKPASPDVYVKHNGLWYDELEPKNGC